MCYIIIPNEIVIGILFGVGLHIMLDQARNPYGFKRFKISSYFYFLIFRIWTGFYKNRFRIDIPVSVKKTVELGDLLCL